MIDTKLSLVKREINNRVIEGYNNKFFSTEEFVRTQDEIEESTSLEQVQVVFSNHYDRIKEAFEKQFTADLTESLAQNLH